MKSQLTHRATRAAAVAALALAAACSDMATDPEADLAPASVVTPFTEEFDAATLAGWSADTHPLGRGSVRSANVSLGSGTASLALPAGAYDGAEIITAARYGAGA